MIKTTMMLIQTKYLSSDTCLLTKFNKVKMHIVNKLEKHITNPHRRHFLVSTIISSHKLTLNKNIYIMLYQSTIMMIHTDFYSQITDKFHYASRLYRPQIVLISRHASFSKSIQVKKQLSSHFNYIFKIINSQSNKWCQWGRKTLTFHLGRACQALLQPTLTATQGAKSKQLVASPCSRMGALHIPTARWTSQGCCPLNVQCCACTECSMDLHAILCLACGTHISSSVRH